MSESLFKCQRNPNSRGMALSVCKSVASCDGRSRQQKLSMVGTTIVGLLQRLLCVEGGGELLSRLRSQSCRARQTFR